MIDLCADDTPELKAWRKEVRDFLHEALPERWIFYYDYDEDPERWERYLAFWRKVGEKGWNSLTWSEDYYGLGRSAIEKWILEEEFARHAAPTYPVIGEAVASHLLRHGTHQQRLKHLKGIADATVLWAEGFSEPGAGSDLASLTTRAHRDGDHWVINGQKTWGTASHMCQWMCVLARTDPDARPHSGISCFLVPLDTPGIEMQALDNLAGGRQNATFFDDVRVPLDCLLGDENKAWTQIWFGMGGDNLDNGGPMGMHYSMRIVEVFDRVVGYCQETQRNGRRLVDDPVIRLQLADLALGMEGFKLQLFESYSDRFSGGPVEFGVASNHMRQAVYKEYWPRLTQKCMEIIGPLAQIQGGKWAQLQGEVEHFFRASFGHHAGGTSQLKRMVLATRGLGLPR